MLMCSHVNMMATQSLQNDMEQLHRYDKATCRGLAAPDRGFHRARRLVFKLPEVLVAREMLAGMLKRICRGELR